MSSTISGLTSGTIYHFQIVATDMAGKTLAGDDGRFVTQPAPRFGFGASH